MSVEINRRRFLEMAGIGGASLIVGGVAGGAIGAAAMNERNERQRFNYESLDAQSFLTVPVVVKKGARVRPHPHIPTETRLRFPRSETFRNRIDWDDIEAINEVPLNGSGAFVIYNTPVVKGQAIDQVGVNWVRQPDESLKPTSYRPTDDEWLLFRVYRKSDKDSDPIAGYVNFSRHTSQYVDPLEFDTPKGISIRNIDGSENVLNDGTVLNPKNTGFIYVPMSPETVAREIMPERWAYGIRAKLDGVWPLQTNDKAYSPTSTGEKILGEVRVVPSGETWAEREDMQAKGTPVNIRDFPNINHRNGEPVTILAKIPQGTVIKRVLMGDTSQYGYHDFGAFRARDIQGKVYSEQGDPIDLNPEQICAVHEDYLQRVSYLASFSA